MMIEKKVKNDEETFFAALGRAGDDELRLDIEIVSNNPVMTGLLTNIGGLIAILNSHRQIISINTDFLKLLGIDDPETALGLRPGEALNCLHADDGPGGCGTGRYCSSCGAAIAIVACLEQEVPIERKCALTAQKGGEPVQLLLQVRANPIRINSKVYILLFLQDVTVQEQQAALARAFFHDVNNMLTMLVQSGELLHMKSPSQLSEIIHQSSVRLAGEIALQKALFDSGTCSYAPRWTECDLGRLFVELRGFFQNHEAARGRVVRFPEALPRIVLRTDGAALYRILLNMVLNALEATEEGGEVSVSLEQQPEAVVFTVWNAAVIPSEIALRIFQRGYSTKKQSGRGIGTYSMKLFGETVLGGKVFFTSGEGAGTSFSFVHPLNAP
ncbi:sensor histidine kinase [Desulfonatronum thiodismutans]|uniref:sensor histidine kinase n=1 Tax=Desulfonatronum thiodismutans TaxID=159290 RepID=UPI000A01FAFD|nr:sensor histidine kinase [Desulfonatronum thiodismutans]